MVPEGVLEDFDHNGTSLKSGQRYRMEMSLWRRSEIQPDILSQALCQLSRLNKHSASPRT